MNWTDEGALYSQIGLFLREDLGRGDLSSQAVIARNSRARAPDPRVENGAPRPLEQPGHRFNDGHRAQKRH